MIAGWLYGMVAISGGVGNGGPLVAIISLPVISFLAVLAHEAGHLVVGVWRGMTPTGITTYPLELRLRPVRLSWVSRRERRRLGGFVMFAPGESSVADRLAMTAAGPAANIFLAIAGGLLLTWAGWPTFLGGEAVAVTGLSLTMAIANLLPYDNNDGAKLVAAWRRWRAGDRRSATG